MAENIQVKNETTTEDLNNALRLMIRDVVNTYCDDFKKKLKEIENKD